MPNLWDALLQSDDETADEKAQSAFKKVAIAALDNGAIPKVGSPEFESGKAEESFDLMDVIPAEKVALGGAAALAKAGAAIKGLAAAKLLGAKAASSSGLGGLALGALKSVAKKEAKELPMDEAARLARAADMGFDTSKTMYHGTHADITGFKVGNRKTGAILGQGSYFTSNPEEAEQYAIRLGGSRGHSTSFAELPEVRQKARELYPEHAAIEDPQELLLKIKNTKGSFDKYKQLMEYMAEQEHVGSNIIPTYLKTSSPIRLEDDASPKLKKALLNELDIPDEIKPSIKKTKKNYELFEFMKGRLPPYRTSQILQDLGHDSVIDGPVTMVLDPSQIRSKFAAFDPSKASSGNISAGIGGAALLGAGAASQNAQAAEPHEQLFEMHDSDPENFQVELNKVLAVRPDLVQTAKKLGLYKGDEDANTR